MGKQSKKLTDFFGGRRRSCMLIQSVLLKSKGNEKRMKLTVSMPLSGTNLTNAPEPFLTQFMVCEKEDSASNHAAIDVQFDSMAASIYSTDDIVNPTVLSHGALLHRFAMIGRARRQTIYQIARLHVRQHWILPDVVQIVPDPIHHLVAVTTEFFVVHAV